MAHPFITIHGKEWNKFLEHFKNAVSILAKKDGLDDDKVDSIVNQYHSLIEDKRMDIFLSTAQAMVKYLNFFYVLPKDGIHDEFKSIYFTGMAISDILVMTGHVEINKLHLRGMLGLLDFRLSTPYNVQRPQLTNRISSIIKNNLVEDHLGKYGWYLIYKCLYNSAVDEAQKTKL